MPLNSPYATDNRSGAPQTGDKHFSGPVLLRQYALVLVCLVVLLAACSSAPTSGPTPTKTAGSSQPTSTPRPSVAPGTVLYQANWSHGLDGWKGTAGWSVVQGELQGDSNNTITITSPYKPTVANYAVEVRLQVVRLLHQNGGFYSIFATQVPGKDGYQAGVSDLKGPGPRPNGSNAQLQIFIEPIQDMPQGTFHPNDNNPGYIWHTYRVEVQGNAATLKVDGNAFSTVTSSQTDTLSNGPLGLTCAMIVLRISSYRIIAL